MCMMYALQKMKKLHVVEILDIFAWEYYTGPLKRAEILLFVRAHSKRIITHASCLTNGGKSACVYPLASSPGPLLEQSDMRPLTRGGGCW